MKSFILRYSRVLLLIALAVALTLASPAFATRENLMNVVRQAALLTMLGMGMTMVIITGGIDLSVGSVLALTSCLAAGLIKSHQTAMWGVLLALGVGLMCGLLNGLMVAKVKLPPFVATYGLQWVARGIAYIFMSGRIIYGFGRGFRFLATGYLAGIPMPVVFMVAIYILFFFLMHYTTFGRSVYAVGSNRKAAELSGLKVDRTIISVYALNGLLVAFVGLLFISRLNAAEPQIGETFALEAIAATLIGGTPFSGGEGGVTRTLIGALILSLLSNGMNLLGVSSFWQPTVLGATIVLAILVEKLAALAERDAS